MHTKRFTEQMANNRQTIQLSTLSLLVPHNILSKLTMCATLIKRCQLSMPRFPHLTDLGNNSTCITGFSLGLNTNVTSLDDV